MIHWNRKTIAMRVVFDVSYIQRGSAGIGRYSLELLKDLLDIDTQNEYILHGWAFTIDGDAIGLLRRENVRLSLARIPGPVKRFYWNRLRAPSIGTFVGQFNVFHGAEPLLPPLGNVPGIITVHDLAYVRHPEFFEKRVLQRDPHVRRSVRQSAAIIVPSLHTKADLVNLFGVDERKIRLVRPPVHRGCSPLRDPLQDDAVMRKYGLNSPFALFVGVIEPRKNVEGIIKAFERLHATHSTDLDLVLVGRNGWLFQGTVRSIARSAARLRIHRLDFVPDKELVSLYRSARFFVYPSFYEGYGSPVAEAMACGLPTITSNNSSLQEIGDRSVMLVDPQNIEELAAAMLELSENGTARDRLSAGGLLRIREIHAQSAAHAIMALYEEVSRR
jgi:glycosyltransferase involved in cell wall biosynthesis